MTIPDLIYCRTNNSTYEEEGEESEQRDDTHCYHNSDQEDTGGDGRHRVTNNIDRPKKVGTKTTTIMKNLSMILLRVIVIVFLLLSCTSYACLRWVHVVVHDQYIVKLFEAVTWTNERAQEEITYYKRECTLQDLTTTNPNDLFVQEIQGSGGSGGGAEPDAERDADSYYYHQLNHGFTVFPNVLSTPTIQGLRKHILSRKNNLTSHESIYVIHNENRFSFALDAFSKDASLEVRTAMQELTTHPTLSKAVSKILGPSPALIEMTAITSSYGAKDQWW